MSRSVALAIAVLLAVCGVQFVRGYAAQAEADVYRARADSLAELAAQRTAEAQTAITAAAERDARIDSLERSHAAERAALDERIAGLTARASVQSAQISRLVTELTPEVRELVQPIFDEYEQRIATLEEIASTALDARDAEAARADSLLLWGRGWQTAALAAEEALGVSEDRAASLVAADDARRRALDARLLGFLPQPRWWMVAAGIAAGFAVSEAR